MTTNERIEHHAKMVDVLEDIKSHQDIIEIERSGIRQFRKHFPALVLIHVKNITYFKKEIKQLEKTYKDLKAKL
jgi:Zn-dependent M32 family carboxypeptidase